MIDRFIRSARIIYATSYEVQRLAGIISRSEPYFKFTRQKITKMDNWENSGPFNIIIEPANYCNARCLMCPYPMMKRPKTFMTPSIFALILSRITKEKLPVNKIFISGMGEPLSDPDIINKLTKLKNGNYRVKLFTNASLLTEEKTAALIDNRVDEINISFNGTNPEQYREVMGLVYDRTLKNISRLVSAGKNHRLPVIRISTVLVSANENDVKRHIAYWKQKADTVTVVRAHEWGGTVKPSTGFRYHKSARTYPCRSLWHTFNLDSRGNFVICCRDYESRHILGNIKTTTFRKAWNHPVIKKFRQNHLKYQEKTLPEMCRKCNFPYQDGIEWYLPRNAD